MPLQYKKKRNLFLGLLYGRMGVLVCLVAVALDEVNMVKGLHKLLLIVLGKCVNIAFLHGSLKKTQ